MSCQRNVFNLVNDWAPRWNCDSFWGTRIFRSHWTKITQGRHQKSWPYFKWFKWFGYCDYGFLWQYFQNQVLKKTLITLTYLCFSFTNIHSINLKIQYVSIFCILNVPHMAFIERLWEFEIKYNVRMELKYYNLNKVQ